MSIIRGTFEGLTPEERAIELQRWRDLEDACECPHCGRCVMCGPPCCPARAKELEDARLRDLGNHPDQVAERHRAKRARAVARRAARRESEGSK